MVAHNKIDQVPSRKTDAVIPPCTTTLKPRGIQGQLPMAAKLNAQSWELILTAVWELLSVFEDFKTKVVNSSSVLFEIDCGKIRSLRKCLLLWVEKTEQEFDMVNSARADPGSFDMGIQTLTQRTQQKRFSAKYFSQLCHSPQQPPLSLLYIIMNAIMSM